MVGGPFPAARIARNPEVGYSTLERARYPDVVEPSPTIGQRPIGGTIAPPRINLFRQRNPLSRHVDPAAMRLRCQQLLAFDRGVRHHFEQLPVRPYVVLVRRDIEIPDQYVTVVAAR